MLTGDKENISNIRNSISRHVPEYLLKSAFVFHLRGGMEYQKLSFKHKTMMTLLYNKIKNLPEDKKTAEDKALIETFNSKVDFVDFDSLNPIAEVL